MKITFCAYDKPDSVGGPVTWLMHLLPSLQEAGFSVNCLIFYHVGSSGPLTTHLLKNKIPFKGTQFNYYTEENISWLLGQLQSDIPHVFVPNLVVPAYLATPWIKKSGIKVVGISHSDDPFYHAIQKEFIDGEASFRLDGMVVVSKELELQLKQSPNKEKIVLKRIPYGVIIPEQKSMWSDDTLRVVYVGRLSEEQKRISEVTKSFCKMVASIDRVEAIIYGDGPDKNNVEEILKADGKDLPISLGGNIPSEEIQKKLLDSHVIVLLSDYEGLPISILEAMACGVVPVCLEMKSGISEQIKNGVTGYIVKDRNHDFFHAISSIKHNYKQWGLLSNNARKLIVDNFSQARCHKAYADFFNGLKVSSLLQEIKMHKKFELPPVNPYLARADRRKPKLSLIEKIKFKARAIKQKIF